MPLTDDRFAHGETAHRSTADVNGARTGADSSVTGDRQAHGGDAPRATPPDRPVRYVQCPTCKARTPWDGNPHRPFCSPTCRWIDLGVWLDERYRVAADDLDDDGEPPEDPGDRGAPSRSPGPPNARSAPARPDALLDHPPAARRRVP